MRPTMRLLTNVLAVLVLPAVMLAAADKPVDPTEALRKSCDKGAAADCRKAAWMFVRGEGVPPDVGRGMSLLKKACEGGEFQGCLELGDRYRDGDGVSKDLPKAV